MMPKTPEAAGVPRVLVVSTGGTIAAAGYAGERERRSGDLLEVRRRLRGLIMGFAALLALTNTMIGELPGQVRL